VAGWPQWFVTKNMQCIQVNVCYRDSVGYYIQEATSKESVTRSIFLRVLVPTTLNTQNHLPRAPGGRLV
jgi:hypothetical protein